ncbi:MAG: cyclic nucleotide-binding domain-containing protein [Prevotellaceae bacterium]|jgi:CRP-like cAMP-binding protein|nr:cyclic nucleotide-binding domain-containing protein [Prevotellaceae bacterium]
MEKKSLHKSDKKLLSQYGLHDIDLSHAVRFAYDNGEVLFHEGDRMEYIYFVVSGKAKVFLSLSDGKRLLLAYFISEGSIGDVELVEGSLTACTTTQAVTDFICIALPLSIYGSILMGSHTFMSYAAKEFAIRLIQRNINSAITTLQPLETRLCAYIIQTAKDGLFRERLTEVADIVGASYRNLLRCFDKLCKDNILHKSSSGFQIVNEQTLNARARGFYMLK